MPDFFAPTCRIQVNGSRLPPEQAKLVQKVSVTTRPSTLDSFSFTVLNTAPQMRWTHTADADVFREGGSVQIEFGYVDSYKPVFDGEITRLSPSFPDEDAPTVEVEGHTRLHWLNGDRKTRTFLNMTDKQIVDRVAREAGLEPESDDTTGTHSHVMQANVTDLEFLSGRARRIRFELLGRERKLVFRRAREGDARVYTLVWGIPQQGFAPGGNNLPLRSFFPRLNTYDQVTSVSVRHFDDGRKKPWLATQVRATRAARWAVRPAARQQYRARSGVPESTSASMSLCERRTRPISMRRPSLMNGACAS